MLKFFVRLLTSAFVVGSFFVLIQDFLVFPGLYASKIFNRKSNPPADISEHKLGSGTPVWELEAEGDRVVILFHGNGDSLQSFYPVQQWLQSIGYSSLSVEFRGYHGRDSGWPSEEALYEDAEEAFELASKKVILFGSSIGTGVASYLAAKKQVDVLVLSSPFYSLTDVAKETPLFGLLHPFLRHSFPNFKWISQLKSTCVINVHGEQDGIVKAEHSKKLEKEYKGSGQYYLDLVPNAGHNDALPRGLGLIENRLKKCLQISS